MDLGNLDELQNQVSDDLQEAKDGLERRKKQEKNKNLRLRE